MAFRILIVATRAWLSLAVVPILAFFFQDPVARTDAIMSIHYFDRDTARNHELNAAIAQNDFELARQLLVAGADPDNSAGDQLPLYRACQAGKVTPMIQLLLEHGACPGQGSWSHPSPIEFARDANLPDLLKTLWAFDDRYPYPTYSFGAFRRALRDNDPTFLENWEVTASKWDYRSEMMALAVEWGRFAFIPLLRRLGYIAPVEEVPGKPWSKRALKSLTDAINEGSPETMAILRENAIIDGNDKLYEPDVAPSKGKRSTKQQPQPKMPLPPEIARNAALLKAVEKMDIEEARRLLSEGASPHLRDPMGCIFAETILSKDKRDMASLLLELGADPNASDDVAVSVLGYAVSHDDIPLARRLLELGADPAYLDRDRLNYMETALSNRSVKMVELLLAYGADLRHINNSPPHTWFREVEIERPELVRGCLQDILWAVRHNELAYLQDLESLPPGHDLSRMPDPIIWALKWGHFDLIPELRRLGIPLPCKSKYTYNLAWVELSREAVKQAVRTGDRKSLKILEDHGILNALFWNVYLRRQLEALGLRLPR